jgi:hypothetical protein
MNLVELETEEEFDAIIKILEDKKESLHSRHFLGAQADDSGEWKWINGGKFAYEIYLEALDSDEQPGSCVEYTSSILKYYIFPCTDTVTQVVCEKQEKKIAGDDKNSKVESTTNHDETTKHNEPEPVEIPDGFEIVGQFGLIFGV